MNPTFGSLFAGVGGFDMGFEQEGYECLFQVEWDKHCQSILQKHWPDVPKFGDVQDVKGDQISPVDVLIFGSPCQDLSVAGKRSGLEGGRSSMFFEAIRIIKEMQNATGGQYPRIAVWENVPGALTSNKGADFGEVLNQMAECGSHLTEWAVLDAQHFGVPQRRRRIFLVAIFDPTVAGNCPDTLFPVAEGRRGDYQKGVKEGQEVAGTLGGGSGSRGWSPDTDRMTFIPAVKTVRSGARDKDGNLPPEVWQETDLAPTLNSMDNTGESRATVLAFPIQGTVIGRSDTAGPQGPGFGQNDDPMFTLDTASQHGVAHITEPIISFTAQRVGEPPRIYEDSTPALLSRMGTGGNNTPMVTQPAMSFGWQENFYAGDTHDEITTALTTSKTPAVQTEYAVRRLTPLECERLMGWSDNHTRWRADGTEQSDSQRYKQCGNGVATPVARWVAEQIRGVL